MMFSRSKVCMSGALTRMRYAPAGTLNENVPPELVRVVSRLVVT